MAHRAAALKIAVNTVLSQQSLDIVGMRGSGRSYFMRRVADLLGDSGWHVLWLQGTGALSGMPFGALQSSGIDLAPASPGKAPLATAVDTLIQAGQKGPLAILVDDWEALDHSSWGALEVARQRAGHPIVRTRIQGWAAPDPAHDSANRPSVGDSGSSLAVNIEALPFDSLKAVVEKHLGGHIEPSTMNRIYAKSGGLAGVAIRMIDSAVLHEALRKDASTWFAHNGLWSPALNGMTEAYLDPLTVEERDAARIIAITGGCDAQTVSSLVSASALESLEARALLRTYISGERELVTLYPPVLTDYLRAEPLHLLKARLSDAIAGNLGHLPLESTSVPLSGAWTTSADNVAFGRLAYEQAQVRVRIAHTEWKRSPSASTANEYVRAMRALDYPRDAFREVFSTSFSAAHDSVAAAELRCAHAEWLAFGPEGLPAAIEVLRETPPEWGEYRRIVDAWSVTLETTLGSLPEDYAARLELAEGLPPEVELALLRAQIHVHIAQGHFRSATRAFDQIDRLSRTHPGYIQDALCALAKFGLGDVESAYAFARHGHAEALGSLNVEAVRVHSALLAYFYERDGQYEEAEKYLDSVFALGEPPMMLTALAVQKTIAITAGLISARRNHQFRVDSILRSLTHRSIPDGALPQQSVALLEAQIMTSTEEPEGAANMLWSRGESLLARGLRFAGVMLQISSVEIWPHSERLTALKATASEVEGELVPALVAYLQFVDARDPYAVDALAHRLRSAGHSGYAISAYDHAVQWFRELGEPQRVDEYQLKRTDFVATLPGNQYESARFNAHQAKLTEREHEVAALVADGMSNPDIADALVLSVRTVETHIRRILRKIGGQARQDIVDYVAVLRE